MNVNAWPALGVMIGGYGLFALVVHLSGKAIKKMRK